MNRYLIKFLALGVFYSQCCFADDITEQGRYITLENKPKYYQVNLMSQVIQIRFTKNIATVGDAINYVLKFSGYNLIAEKNRALPLKNILAKPLPIVDRQLGPISLKEALNVLIGPAFSLAEDPVNRVINFTLKPEYNRFIKSN